MNDKGNSVKQYSSQYMRETLSLTLIIALPISLMFFIIGLLHDVIAYDLLISLFPLLLCGIIYLFVCAKTKKFMNMIRQQEDLFNMCFSKDSLKPLYPKTLLYCSESWFIKAGCWAFHKKYLERITVHTINEKSPARSYIVEFQSIDGRKYIERNMRSGDIEKLKKWHEKS